MKNHLTINWRENMRDWAMIWRQWRDICPITAALALQSAITRRDWDREDRNTFGVPASAGSLTPNHLPA